MAVIISQIGRIIINIFLKLWHRDKKLFVIVIAGLILIPIFYNMNYQEELNDSKRHNSVLVLMLWFLVSVGLYFKQIFRTSKSRDISRNVLRRGWTEIEKEQVRIRQDGKCKKCGRPPPRWEYHHKDGNRSNNSISNCEGLCPNCHSVKTHD